MESEKTYSLAELAGIEYRGVAGVTPSCLDALHHLVQCGVPIHQAILVSSENIHGFLLKTEFGQVGSKSGFASGYLGTGSYGLSKAIALIDRLGIDIDEVIVSQDLMYRLDQSALTVSDIEMIEAAAPVRPSRLYDFVRAEHFDQRREKSPWQDFEPVMPFALIDRRIADLAGQFFNEPDTTILRGFRRLESILRDRIGSQKDGGKLFSEAFLGDSPKLTWANVPDSERIGRGNMFTGAYAAHRNPRSHKEVAGADYRELLSEFLALNHLFRLEAEAVRPEDKAAPTASG